MENFGKQLTRLIHICGESRQKYLRGAEDLKSGELHNILIKIAEKRLGLITELQNQLASHSTVDPEQHTDIIGSLHKAWTDMKTALAGHKERDILEICRSGDHSLLETYDEILQGDVLYSDLKPMLVQQRTSVSEDYQQINNLYFDHFPPARKEL